MAWITSPDRPGPAAGPAHADPAALDLLRAGIGLRFRLVDAAGVELADGRWLNSRDCEPAEHPHRQPLADLAARHPGAAIEYETAPGQWAQR